MRPAKGAGADIRGGRVGRSGMAGVSPPRAPPYFATLLVIEMTSCTLWRICSGLDVYREAEGEKRVHDDGGGTVDANYKPDLRMPNFCHPAPKAIPGAATYGTPARCTDDALQFP